MATRAKPSNPAEPDVCIVPSGPSGPGPLPHRKPKSTESEIQKMSIGGLSTEGAKKLLKGKMPDSAGDKLLLANASNIKKSSGDEAGVTKEKVGSATIVMGKAKAHLKP